MVPNIAMYRLQFKLQLFVYPQLNDRTVLFLLFNLAEIIRLHTD